MSIRCAHCKGRHESVAEVRECVEYEAYAKWTAEVEIAAEAAVERFFEEGPGGPVDDPRERELWAIEDMRRDEAARAYEAQCVARAKQADNNGCENGTCSWHDRCMKHRAEDARRGVKNAMFKAYND